MKSSVEKWVKESADTILKEIGIKKGHRVLDFGCGSGNYTIAAARVVGKQGLVYALDEDEESLNQLMHRAKSIGLKNIIRLDASHEPRIGLADKSIDVVLLYDVLHYYYFPKEEDRRQLLRRLYRILRANGLLSLYPTHLQSHMEPNLKDVRRGIEEAGFYQEREYSVMIMVHDDNLEQGCIINFRKGREIGT